MVKIYTKTGDDGTTALVSGNRILKSDVRIDLYGDVDELNSYLGLISSQLEKLAPKDLKAQVEIIQSIQHNLFNLGSQLACELSLREKYKLPSLDGGLIQRVENAIDLMDSKVPKLKNFILPGGSEASSFVHLARTMTRRLERKMVRFQSEVEPAPEYTLALLNRLSDYFFMLARFINFELGISENIWKK